MTVQNNFMLLLKVPLLYFPPSYSHDFGTGVQKDSWKAELKEFSSNNGYDLNKNGDSAPLLLDVLEGFLKYELALKLIDTEQFRRYRPSYNVSPGRDLTVVRREDGSGGDGAVL
ncbi:hypothetical protein ACSBR1_036838 [Camellia fascicularis]